MALVGLTRDSKLKLSSQIRSGDPEIDTDTMLIGHVFLKPATGAMARLGALPCQLVLPQDAAELNQPKASDILEPLEDGANMDDDRTCCICLDTSACSVATNITLLAWKAGSKRGPHVQRVGTSMGIAWAPCRMGRCLGAPASFDWLVTAVPRLSCIFHFPVDPKVARTMMGAPSMPIYQTTRRGRSSWPCFSSPSGGECSSA